MDIHIIIFCFIQSWFYLTNKFGGIARDKGIWLHIVRDNTAGSDHSILTDGNSGQDGAPAPIHTFRQICTGLQVIT